MSDKFNRSSRTPKSGGPKRFGASNSAGGKPFNKSGAPKKSGSFGRKSEGGPSKPKSEGFRRSSDKPSNTEKSFQKEGRFGDKKRSFRDNSEREGGFSGARKKPFSRADSGSKQDAPKGKGNFRGSDNRGQDNREKYTREKDVRDNKPRFADKSEKPRFPRRDNTAESGRFGTSDGQRSHRTTEGGDRPFRANKPFQKRDGDRTDRNNTYRDKTDHKERGKRERFGNDSRNNTRGNSDFASNTPHEGGGKFTKNDHHKNQRNDRLDRKQADSANSKPGKRSTSNDGSGKNKTGAKPRLMTPDSWSAKGEAVVTYPDNRVLVWAGIPQETALVQITHKGQNQEFGYVVLNKESATTQFAFQPSQYRREAPCKRYNRCGGCPFMHMTEEGQEWAKLGILRDAFAELHIPVQLPTQLISGVSNWEYRMVSKLVAGKGAKGSLILGARNRDGDIVTIPECMVTDTQLNEVGKEVEAIIDELKIYPYTPQNPTGIRYITSRKSASSGEILVTIVATRRTEHIDELAERIYELPFSIAGVLLHLNTSEGNAIFDQGLDGSVRMTTLVGSSYITETVHDIEYQLGAGDFFQVNVDVAGLLQEDVVNISKRFHEYPMVDLYCGVGFFTLALAKEHGGAVGIETVQNAVEKAKYSADANKIPAEFYSGDVLEELHNIEKKLKKASPFFVIDPARRGLEDGVLDALLQYNPAGVLYVSCHPKSLARDVQLFLEKGWRIDGIQAYDMFPQTMHVETVVVLLPPASAVLVKKKAKGRRLELVNSTANVQVVDEFSNRRKKVKTITQRALTRTQIESLLQIEEEKRKNLRAKQERALEEDSESSSDSSSSSS